MLINYFQTQFTFPSISMITYILNVRKNTITMFDDEDDDDDDEKLS